MIDVTLKSLGIRNLGGKITRTACELVVERKNGSKVVIGGRTLTEARLFVEELFASGRARNAA